MQKMILIFLAVCFLMAVSDSQWHPHHIAAQSRSAALPPIAPIIALFSSDKVFIPSSTESIKHRYPFCSHWGFQSFLKWQPFLVSENVSSKQKVLHHPVTARGSAQLLWWLKAALCAFSSLKEQLFIT